MDAERVKGEVMNGPCLCGATDCPSCGPAQGYDLDCEAAKVLAESVMEEWLSDVESVSEYMAWLDDSDYQAIEAAFATRNPIKHMEAVDSALKKHMLCHAIEEAHIRIKEARKQAEDDAAEERGYSERYD
jgi:hypothetical protein